MESFLTPYGLSNSGKKLQFTVHSEEPLLWRRFVDDVIAIVTKETGNKSLQHLNSQHPRIKFTLDEEEGGCLPFEWMSALRASWMDR